MLLDCGEGTLGQLTRHFGSSSTRLAFAEGAPPSPVAESALVGVDACLAALQLVFISHMHADHHLGLASILTARHRVLMAVAASQAASASIPATATPLIVVGPTRLAAWLAELQAALGQVISYVFVDNADFDVRARGEGTWAGVWIVFILS